MDSNGVQRVVLAWWTKTRVQKSLVSTNTARGLVFAQRRVTLPLHRVSESDDGGGGWTRTMHGVGLRVSTRVELRIF